jgi:hypothetical protein
MKAHLKGFVDGFRVEWPRCNVEIAELEIAFSTERESVNMWAD